jgi:alpha-1,3-glucosyltransferase
MEITNNLPTNQWYYYKLDYWGLDYPPLTAYHSWLLGYWAKLINYNWISLDESRGFESINLKFYMRMTVLLSELIIYYPALFYYLSHTTHQTRSISHTTHQTRSTSHITTHATHQTSHTNGINKLLLITLLQPSLIIIDHGHFQYNSVMLGLTTLSVALLQRQHYLLGSIAFVLSLTFKQMALYYSLPIFIFLLSTCFSQSLSPTPSHQSHRANGLTLLAKIAITVILTFTLVFYPFTSKTLLKQVLHRIFPTSRGVFEDKVASFWCAISPFVKVRQYPQQLLVWASISTTLVSSIPSLVNLFKTPTPEKLVYSLANVSLAFFLFSFHVHEKTILLPLLPISLLQAHEPWLVSWFGVTSLFSMYHPLLKREGLSFAYMTLMSLWIGLTYSFAPKTVLEKRLNLVKRASYVAMVGLHFIDILVSPPPHLPDLWTMASVVLSCIQFFVIALYLNIRQTTIQSTKSTIQSTTPRTQSIKPEKGSKESKR